MNSLTLYRSSAGSGKTTLLVTQYIKLALISGFRHVLGVTFTNKATYELKERIVERLASYAKGESDVHSKELIEVLNSDESRFQQQCQSLLNDILNDYGSFSISTIDSFFQRVIRGFAFDIGINGNFNLELDNRPVIAAAIANLIDEAGKDEQLTEWMLQFVRERAFGGKDLRLTPSMEEMSHALLAEDFKVIRHDIIDKLKRDVDGVNRKKFHQKLISIIEDFDKQLVSFGQEAMQILSEYGLAYDELKQGKNGVGGIFKRMEQGTEPNMGNSYLIKALNDENEWATAKSPKREAIMSAVGNGLHNLLQSSYQYYYDNIREVNTAKAILENFYTFGISAELLLRMNKIKKEQEILLISDSTDFLAQITSQNDTPFIYEKIGNQFYHYLIDEFQDTSQLQWQNFVPLINNSTAMGKECILVGDVKQSIYRWRGGDLSLINEKVEKEFKAKVSTLDTNFRSLTEIIDFNNQFFLQGIFMLQDFFEKSCKESDDGEIVGKYATSIQKTYADVKQNIPKRPREGGYVNLRFFDEVNTDEFKESSLSELVKEVEDLQDQGYKAGDIAILVRKKDEAAAVMSHFLKYRKSKGDKSTYSYDLMASDALRVSASPIISLIIECLRWITNNREMASYYSFWSEHLMDKDSSWFELFESTKSGSKNNSNEIDNYLRGLSASSLLDMIDGIVEKFHLNEYEEELIYLFTLRDLAIKFTDRKTNDVLDFIQWWDEEGFKKEVPSSENNRSIQLLTIHKSKGLQFKCVLIPFCTWGLDDIINKTTSVFWAKQSGESIQDFPYYPVQFGKKLLKSYFAESFIDEKSSQWIDNINLLYVALTRAQESLFIHTRSVKKPDTISDLFNEVFKDRESEKVEFGKLPKIEDTTGLDENALQAKAIASLNWKSKVSISHRELIKTDEAVYSKLEQGEVFHDILSKEEIFKGDKKDLLKGFLHADRITEKELVLIEEVIGKIQESEDLPFMKNIDAMTEMNERAILTREGIIRPDKVLVDEDMVYVLDFKSGKVAESHQNQVRRYMNAVSTVEQKKVEGYVIYLQPFKVLKVS